MRCSVNMGRTEGGLKMMIRAFRQGMVSKRSVIAVDVYSDGLLRALEGKQQDGVVRCVLKKCKMGIDCSLKVLLNGAHLEGYSAVLKGSKSKGADVAIRLGQGGVVLDALTSN